MSAIPEEEDEAQRRLDELYKDGRAPTLQESEESTKKYGLELVSAKFPPMEEK